MPNPFKEPGSAYQQGGEWVASGFGLTGKLATRISEGKTGNVALVGTIGSGKSTALDHYQTSIGTSGLVLLHRLDTISQEKLLDLREPVINQMIDRLGSRAYDAVSKAKGLLGHSAERILRSDQKLELITGMAEISKGQGKPVHLLVDEAQEPAERLTRAQEPSRIADWFTNLKVLAEAIRRGGGCTVITITPDPWSQAAKSTSDRFFSLLADPPEPAEVDVFIQEGLKHTGGDLPDRAARGLGARILRAHEGEIVTVRQLHEWLHIAWDRAHRASAAQLGAAHLA